MPGDFEHMPEEIEYDQASMTLHIGSGQIRPVPQRVWEYEVSGMHIVKRWFEYRKKKPRVRRSSPLNDIRATTWDANLTGELLDLLNVLGGCVALESTQ
ncbi:MAG: type ISP restriction/modification enzyme, partial [Pseudonocardiaceae bacterium]